MEPGTAYGTHGHENEVNGHAPGDLELVRSFVSLHDHPDAGRDSLPPSGATIDAWLRAHGMISSPASAQDLDRAASVLDDLRSTAIGEATEEHRERLNEAARRGGVSLCFACIGDEPIHASAEGVDGALGRLLGITFLAELDGSWDRLRGCANPVCRTVFWDRSKNRSGRWCSMGSCGNKAKVRAYRERAAAL
ncbi:MAG TPA: CGNR zinc finger domain-containing protein [Actinomycetota bacterium]|nr:CGNR zinc finger domain-containing protein [Actinomycetota bacterium]